MAGIAYFFVCAQPLPKELVLKPAWARSIASAPRAPSGRPPEGGAIPFRLGGSFGYFTAEGELPFVAAAGFGVALSNEAFAPYERLSEGFAMRNPAGRELGRATLPGYPFFAAGRRFVIGPGQDSVSELRVDGSVAWSYDFSSIATAFGASPSLAVFGLMDGSLVGLDPAGREVLDFSPGGSRVPCIYGVAVSPDGLLVAAISGLDRQRLVVLEKRSSAFRVTYHRWMDSDFRRPVAMGFTADGSRLVFELPGAVGVYDRAARRESALAAVSREGLGLTARAGDLLVLLAGGGEEKRLVCAAAQDRRVVDISFRAAETFLDVRGDSIFLGADGTLVRMDLREE